MPVLVGLATARNVWEKSMVIAPLLIAGLKRYWPFLVGALIIGGTLTYIKVLRVEVEHYKKAVVTAKAETKRVTLQFQKVVKFSLPQIMPH